MSTLMVLSTQSIQQVIYFLLVSLQDAHIMRYLFIFIINSYLITVLKTCDCQMV